MAADFKLMEITLQEPIVLSSTFTDPQEGPINVEKTEETEPIEITLQEEPQKTVEEEEEITKLDKKLGSENVAESDKQEEEIVADPTYNGFLFKKTSNLVKIMLKWTKCYFVFETGAIPLDNLKIYYRKNIKKSKDIESIDNKLEYERYNECIFKNIAHAAQTGDGLLFYYKTDSDVKEKLPSGIINLLEIKKIEELSEECGKPYAFKIETSYRTFELAADSKLELNRWIMIISKKSEEFKSKSYLIETSDEYKANYEKLVKGKVFEVTYNEFFDEVSSEKSDNELRPVRKNYLPFKLGGRKLVYDTTTITATKNDKEINPGSEWFNKDVKDQPDKSEPDNEPISAKRKPYFPFTFSKKPIEIITSTVTESVNKLTKSTETPNDNNEKENTSGFGIFNISNLSVKVFKKYGEPSDAKIESEPSTDATTTEAKGNPTEPNKEKKKIKKEKEKKEDDTFSDDSQDSSVFQFISGKPSFSLFKGFKRTSKDSEIRKEGETDDGFERTFKDSEIYKERESSDATESGNEPNIQESTTLFQVSTITIHTRKVSPFKSNIYVSKKMTFNDLILFIFPNGAPNGKKFIIKSSLDTDAEEYLPNQLISDVFYRKRADIWIDLETELMDLDELF